MATKPPVLNDDSLQQASQVPEGTVQRDPTERVLGMGVTPGGSLDRALQQHHQARTAQAQMYRGILANKLSQIYHKNEYFDPQTQQTRALTDQEVQNLQAQADEAEKNYSKIIGVSPEAKDAHGKARQIIDFLTGQKHAQAQQRPGGLQIPPTPQYGTTVTEQGVIPTPAPGANVGEAGVAIAPPPTPQRQPSALQQSMMGQFGQHRQQVGQTIEDYSRGELADADTRRALVNKVIPEADQNKPYVQDFILTGKITGNMGAMLRPPPRPVGSYTTSVLDARSRASKTGEVFLNVAGEPIPIDDLDDSMGLKGMQTLNPTTGQWQVRYEPFSPNQSSVTADNQVFAVNPMDKSKIPQGAGTVVGAHNVPVTSTHTAPGVTLSGEIGNVTTSTTRTPMTPGGARGVAGRTTNAPTPGTATAPPATGGRVGAVPQTRGGVPSAGRGNEQAIPFGAANQLNQRIIPVREAATQLFGDPTQPEQKGLADYSDLADGKHEDLAKALRLTMSGLINREHAAKGGLRELIGNYLGEPQALVDSQVGVLQDTIGKLSPEDKEAYNAEMTALGTVMGMRSLTKMGAYQFSMDALEREVPMFGYNTFSKEQFYDKMSRLAEQVYNGSRTVPMPKAEKDYYAGLVKQYRQLAGGRKGGGAPPPSPTGATAPKTADEYLSKFGIKPAKKP